MINNFSGSKISGNFIIRGIVRCRGRRAMILPLILVIMFVFFLFFMALMSWNSQNRRIAAIDVVNKRAEILAKGGYQLALLKVSLMPTECYDALAISQLRNPYFSMKYGVISNPKDAHYNPGPQFLVSDPGKRTSLLQDSGYVGTVAEPLSGFLNEFVKVFSDDIRFPGAGVDSAGERKTPFSHGFRATKVKVMAVKGQQLYNKQTVEFTIRAWVYDHTGIKKEKDYTNIVEVSREGI